MAAKSGPLKVKLASVERMFGPCMRVGWSGRCERARSALDRRFATYRPEAAAIEESGKLANSLCRKGRRCSPIVKVNGVRFAGDGAGESSEHESGGDRRECHNGRR